jgi:hypothetical protein
VLRLASRFSRPWRMLVSISHNCVAFGASAMMCVSDSAHWPAGQAAQLPFHHGLTFADVRFQAGANPETALGRLNAPTSARREP